MNLQARKKEYFTLNIEGVGEYKIPLAKSLSPAEAEDMMRAIEGGTMGIWVFEFFNKYLDEKAQEVLTVEDINAIGQAWDEASNPTAGELQASSE